MILIALIIGAMYGYTSVRGQFCMNSGFSNVIRQKDFTKLKSFATAILVQMLVLPFLFAILYLYEPSRILVSAIGLPPLFLIGSAIGGLFFGIFMYYAAGCGAGIFYKIGEKNLGALIATLGFAIGIYITEKGILKVIRETSQNIIVIDQQPFWKGGSALIFACIITLTSAVILFLLFKNKDEKPKGAIWGWKKTGLIIGVIGTLGWILALLSNSPYSMAIIPGIMDAIDFNYSWGVLFVIGILLGSFYSTRNDKSKRFIIPKYNIIFKRLFGGFGLGISGSIAAGCTVGHGLAFTPLLGIGSLISTLFIFIGSGLVGYLTRK